MEFWDDTRLCINLQPRGRVDKGVAELIVVFVLICEEREHVLIELVLDLEDQPTAGYNVLFVQIVRCGDPPVARRVLDDGVVVLVVDIDSDIFADVILLRALVGGP